MSKNGLVLEGGAMRGMFTAGVLDVLMENGIKFEVLAVDLVALMEKVLPYEVIREKEFAPIKNKTGVDSVESARKLLQLNGVEL